MDKSNVNQIGQMKSQKQKSAAAWMNRTEHKVSHGSGSDLMSWSRSTPDALHLFICTDWVRRPESRWSSDNEKHQPNRMHANGQFIKKRTGTRNGVTVEGARLEAQVAHHCLLNSRLYTNRFHKDCCWNETYKVHPHHLQPQVCCCWRQKLLNRNPCIQMPELRAWAA